MEIERKRVIEMMKEISENRVYLPAIQRRFVWNYDKITILFDSIMRDYPIGSFLFWEVADEAVKEYTFYKFIQEYDERNPFNEKAENPILKQNMIGVLDGQQRLSSLYVALQGSYRFKHKYAKKKNPNAYALCHLYFNLLKPPTERENEEFIYEFKFLTEEESRQKDETHFWFSVRDILSFKELNDCNEYAKKHDFLGKNPFTSNLIRLYERLVTESPLVIYKLKEPDLDRILDIFIRVNSGGKQLSKTDMLFSTVVANWNEGREQIEELLITIKGHGFGFDTDNIMRTCLMLVDAPIVLKTNNFKPANVTEITSQWENIKNAINTTINLLVEFGFNGETLTSNNAIIPLAYHIFKGGKLDEESKLNMKKYLVVSLLNQIYGGQSDSVLIKIRDALRQGINSDPKKYELRKTTFDYFELAKTELPGNKSLQFDEDDLSNVFEQKKGEYTFMVLSLLYPHLKFGQIEFHQDHMNPACFFDKSKLVAIGFSNDKIEHWQSMRDKLPNLQLLVGSENEHKLKTPLENYIAEQKDQTYYCESNFISKEVNCAFDNFEEFYNKRLAVMKEKLREILIV